MMILTGNLKNGQFSWNQNGFSLFFCQIFWNFFGFKLIFWDLGGIFFFVTWFQGPKKAVFWPKFTISRVSKRDTNQIIRMTKLLLIWNHVVNKVKINNVFNIQNLLRIEYLENSFSTLLIPFTRYEGQRVATRRLN